MAIRWLWKKVPILKIYRATSLDGITTSCLMGTMNATQVFNAQDSYIKPDYPQPYDKLIEEWRSFNYVVPGGFPTRKTQ